MEKNKKLQRGFFPTIPCIYVTEVEGKNSLSSLIR